MTSSIREKAGRAPFEPRHSAIVPTSIQPHRASATLFSLARAAVAQTRKWHSIATVLFFLCVLFVLTIPIKTTFNFYDEGFTVFNATRVMNGDISNKDFWTIYPPGQFYALAAIFKILGTNLIVARIYDTFGDCSTPTDDF